MYHKKKDMFNTRKKRERQGFTVIAQAGVHLEILLPLSPSTRVIGMHNHAWSAKIHSELYFRFNTIKSASCGDSALSGLFH